MLGLISRIAAYRTIKNGLLLDYYIKKYAIIIATELFINFGLFFVNKYFIEYLFTLVTQAYAKLLNFQTTFTRMSFLMLFNILVYLLFIVPLVFFIMLINRWSYFIKFNALGYIDHRLKCF